MNKNTFYWILWENGTINDSNFDLESALTHVEEYNKIEHVAAEIRPNESQNKQKQFNKINKESSIIVFADGSVLDNYNISHKNIQEFRDCLNKKEKIDENLIPSINDIRAANNYVEISLNKEKTRLFYFLLNRIDTKCIDLKYENSSKDQYSEEQIKQLIKEIKEQIKEEYIHLF